MARRPTLHDVARKAGLISATVDRVLNAREKVREDTARSVYLAARSLGYHADALIGQRVQYDLPRLRLDSGGRRAAYHPLPQTNGRDAVANITAAKTGARFDIAA